MPIPHQLGALRKLKITLGVLLLFAVFGTVGLHIIEGWSWFDSLYMVVMTFTTVGYFEVHPLSHAGRILNLILMVGGVGTVFFAIGATTYALMEAELDTLFGRRRMERDIQKL